MLQPPPAHQHSQPSIRPPPMPNPYDLKFHAVQKTNSNTTSAPSAGPMDLSARCVFILFYFSSNLPISSMLRCVGRVVQKAESIFLVAIREVDQQVLAPCMCEKVPLSWMAGLKNDIIPIFFSYFLNTSWQIMTNMIKLNYYEFSDIILRFYSFTILSA